MPDQRDPVSSGLENRVGRLETSMEFVKGEISNLSHGQQKMSEDLSRQISSIGEKMADNGKTDWKTIATFAGLACAATAAFWQVTKAPLEHAIVRNEAAIQQLKNDEREIDRDFGKGLKDIAGAIVPRGEHERIWSENNRRFDNLEHGVEKLRDRGVELLYRRLDENKSKS